MRRYPYIFVVASMFIVPLSCSTSDRSTEIKQVASAEDLGQLMTDSRVLVVHTLDASNYQAGHVPGAVHIEYEKMTVDDLPRDRATPVVFYCAGPGCPVSGMAARKAARWGFTDVHVYEGGIKGWRAAGRPVVQGAAAR